MTRVLIIGAGGIGSQLIDMLIPALTAGDLTRNSGGVIISVMDDDRVEISNISHQRHEPRMVGQLKVESIIQRQSSFISHSLRLIPISERLENSSQLVDFDLVVVAVDNSRTRQLVHNYADKWLDLRCGSDGYVSLDNTLDHELVERLTPNQPKPASCQLPGALENSNVEVGYALAAAHGVQWIIQNIRRNVGVNTYPPPPRAFSLTHGILPLFDDPRLPIVPEVDVDYEREPFVKTATTRPDFIIDGLAIDVKTTINTAKQFNKKLIKSFALIQSELEALLQSVITETAVFKKSLLDANDVAIPPVQGLPVHNGDPWLEEEDQTLIEELADGLRIPDIAERHSRTDGAIRSRRRHLYLSAGMEDDTVSAEVASFIVFDEEEEEGE